MIKICVIGLGYVGLPLLINLSKKFNCIGFDINSKRVRELNKGKDVFKEFSYKMLKNKEVFFTNSKKKIKDFNLFIVAVPTPIYKNKKPNLSHLKNVCDMLSKVLKPRDIVIFESTVYPGVTDEFCTPILEKKSKLKEGLDFYIGYSPERVNPGDHNHGLKKINKILAYPHEYFKKRLLKVYSNICKKIVLTKNIKEAETAKVIENIQRDVNIGLINEIYLVCKKLGISFDNVIKLASTKWNFLKFRPGLVGGHCLPVDPYYFSFISKKNKINTKITLAGRFINDAMSEIVLKNIINHVKKIDPFKTKKILICGLSYKANVSDLRNSLSLKIYNKLKRSNKKIFGYDPLIDTSKAKKMKLILTTKQINSFDIFIILTNHKIFNRIFKNKKKYFPI